MFLLGNANSSKKRKKISILNVSSLSPLSDSNKPDHHGASTVYEVSNSHLLRSSLGCQISIMAVKIEEGDKCNFRGSESKTQQHICHKKTLKKCEVSTGSRRLFSRI